ncbi:putative defense protein 1 [Ylistrum balloti]|uniref:putative defense protein 1 n=1 Tax=Ylistrum balloti TaxID=509963 RepID=UPI0029058CDC|nr:putative defense protein 1 [Ylistrum balloti]
MTFDPASLIPVVISLALLALTDGFPFGETDTDCTKMIPSQLTSLPQRGPAPYNITVSMNMHGVGMELIVSIKATGKRKIRGVMIQARSAECPLPGKSVSSTPIGSFTNVEGTRTMKPINCFKKTNSAIINLNWGIENSMEATWKVEAPEQRKIRFYATVVDNEQTYWVGIHSETIRHITDTAEDDGIACQREISTHKPVSPGSLTNENGVNKLFGASTPVLIMSTLLISMILKHT